MTYHYIKKKACFSWNPEPLRHSVQKGGGGCKFNSLFFGVNFSHDILTPQVKVNMWETAVLETAMLKKWNIHLLSSSLNVRFLKTGRWCIFYFMFYVLLFMFWNVTIICTEPVAQKCSVKKAFLEISQNLQENTCARVSFLIKLKA